MDVTEGIRQRYLLLIHLPARPGPDDSGFASGLYPMSDTGAVDVRPPITVPDAGVASGRS
jgi:hypothetical protein